MKDIVLPDDIKSEIALNISDFCRKIRKKSPEKALEFIISSEYLQTQSDYYCSTMQKLSVDPIGKKILEIGSGFGFFILHAIKNMNWNIYGIEPGVGAFEGRFNIARKILEQNNIELDRLVEGVGENLPFESNSFDIIISNDVLEHVKDPGLVLREAFRVLRPGGALIFNFNNFRWIYEGHYNVFWFPFMSKLVAKKYVTMLGRDSGYIDQLNFLDPGKIRKIIKNIPGAKCRLPLYHRSVDFMLKRARTYLNCTQLDGHTSLTSFVLNILIVIFSSSAGKHLMQLFSRCTGIYHEIHLILQK